LKKFSTTEHGGRDKKRRGLLSAYDVVPLVTLLFGDQAAGIGDPLAAAADLDTFDGDAVDIHPPGITLSVVPDLLGLAAGIADKGVVFTGSLVVIKGKAKAHPIIVGNRADIAVLVVCDVSYLAAGLLGPFMSRIEI
jgi:hypothetical protein